jgi:hypothetical protein
LAELMFQRISCSFTNYRWYTHVGVFVVKGRKPTFSWFRNIIRG